MAARPNIFAVSQRSPRSLLLEAFQSALRAVDGRVRVRDYLRVNPIDRPCALIATGKAAAAMARGAADALGAGVQHALLVTKHGHCDPVLPDVTPATCLGAGHPVPDGASLAAGEALLEFVDGLPEDVPLLFLLSGGTSALVEVLPEGMGLAELAAVNRWLLGSGWGIGATNRVRKALSCIKGGRLAARMGGRTVLNLIVSDVPGDDPATVGSGPLLADTEAGAPDGALPPWIREWMGRAPPVPAAGDPCFRGIRTVIVARNRDARGAAVRAGRGLGLPVHDETDLLQGDAVETGERLAKTLMAGPAGFYVWGGETTVRLPPEPGRGGRCQALALSAALWLEGRDDIVLLAAGTDGSDGPTEDAGALVDGGTVDRGTAEGFDALDCLERADAGSFLQASGDLINTGPTGTNVMDLVIAVKTAPR